MGIRVTAILNLKGGVGKTTTVINMAYVLAKIHGKRVLVLDADSQCNTTEFFGAWSDDANMATLLRMPHLNDFPGGIFGVRRTAFDNIDILPASDELMELDLSKVEQGTANANALRELVKTASNDYDYVLIDCPPAFNAASAAALIAANDVIIPIKLDAFSLRGMTNLLRQIQLMRKINPHLSLVGCLPTMWYAAPEIVAAERQLRGAQLPVLHRIRRSDKVDAMTFAQEPLCVFSPRSAPAVDYRKFVAEEYLGGGDHV